MSRLTAILKSKQKFPKPISNWDFGNASKIQEGATAVDVAGWTGESLKAGVSTIDLTQTTAAAQPVFDTDHIVFDGSDYLEGLPIQSGDFTYIVKLDTDDGVSTQALIGETLSNDIHVTIIPSTNFIRYRSSQSVNNDVSFDVFGAGVFTLAITKSGTDVTIYADGNPLGSFVDTGSVAFERIGKRGSAGNEFGGDMYNFLIYPTGLTAEEVAAKTASLA